MILCLFSWMTLPYLISHLPSWSPVYIFQDICKCTDIACSLRTLFTMNIKFIFKMHTVTMHANFQAFCIVFNRNPQRGRGGEVGVTGFQQKKQIKTEKRLSCLAIFFTLVDFGILDPLKTYCNPGEQQNLNKQTKEVIPGHGPGQSCVYYRFNTQFHQGRVPKKTRRKV